jgi:acetyltransferase
VALPPVDRDTALGLVGRLRVSTLLAGYRGARPADVGALADAVVALGVLAVELGDHLDGLDLNPVLVDAHAAYCVDALVLPRRPV